MSERAWTHDEDRILLDAVLKCLKNNEPKHVAFSEVAEKLTRTKSAVRFRYYGVVRSSFIDEVTEAERERVRRINMTS